MPSYICFIYNDVNSHPENNNQFMIIYIYIFIYIFYNDVDSHPGNNNQFMIIYIYILIYIFYKRLEIINIAPDYRIVTDLLIDFPSGKLWIFSVNMHTLIKHDIIGYTGPIMHVYVCRFLPIMYMIIFWISCCTCDSLSLLYIFSMKIRIEFSVNS